MVIAVNDPYQTLGISPNATLAEIRSRYRQLAKLLHPDRVSATASDEERKKKEDAFKDVQNAYETLSDETKRFKYDERVKQEEWVKAKSSDDSAKAGMSSAARERASGANEAKIRVKVERTQATPSPSPRHYDATPPEKMYDQYRTTKESRNEREPLRRAYTYAGRGNFTYSTHTYSSTFPRQNAEVVVEETRFSDDGYEFAHKDRGSEKEKNKKYEKKSRDKEKAAKAAKAERKSSSSGKSTHRKDEKPSRKYKVKEPYIEISDLEDEGYFGSRPRLQKGFSSSSKHWNGKYQDVDGYMSPDSPPKYRSSKHAPSPTTPPSRTRDSKAMNAVVVDDEDDLDMQIRGAIEYMRRSKDLRSPAFTRSNTNYDGYEIKSRPQPSSRDSRPLPSRHHTTYTTTTHRTDYHAEPSHSHHTPKRLRNQREGTFAESPLVYVDSHSHGHRIAAWASTDANDYFATHCAHEHAIPTVLRMPYHSVAYSSIPHGY